MLKRFLIALSVLAVIIFAVFRVASALSIFMPVQGGTGTSQVPIYGQLLIDVGSSGVYTPVSTTSLGITGTPAGSNTDIQFNNNGAFGGSNNFTWNGSNVTVTGTATTTGQFNLNTTGYPQGIIGAYDASPNANLEINSQSQGPFTAYGLKNNSNGGASGALVLDTQDSPAGLANPLIVDNILGNSTCLEIKGGSYGCLDDYNTFAALFAVIGPPWSVSGSEAGLTTTMQGQNGNDNTDYGIQQYGAATGIDAYQNYYSTSYNQPLAEPDFSFWEQANGNTSEATTAWHFAVATTSVNGTLATTTVLCFGDVGTTTVNAFSNCSFKGATVNIVSSSSRQLALGVFSNWIATSTTLLSVYNNGNVQIPGSASTTQLTASGVIYTPQVTASGNFGLTSNGASLTWDGGEFYPNANGTKSLGLLTNEWASSFVNGTASSSNVNISALGTPAGAFLAIDPQGHVIATTTPTTGSNSPATSTNPLMATYVVATSTTQASLFPEASTTNITASGVVYTPQLTASGNLGFTSNSSSLTWDGGEFYPNANGTKSLGLLTNEWVSSFVSGTASSTNVVVSSLGTPAGTFLAADPTGKIIATSTANITAASSTLLIDNNTFSGANIFRSGVGTTNLGAQFSFTNTNNGVTPIFQVLGGGGADLLQLLSSNQDIFQFKNNGTFVQTYGADFAAHPLQTVFSMASSTGGGTGTSTIFHVDSGGNTYVGTVAQQSFATAAGAGLAVTGQAYFNNNVFITSTAGVWWNSVNGFTNGIQGVNLAAGNGFAFVPTTNLGGGAQSRTYFDHVGNWGVGTSSPFGRFVINLNSGDVAPGNNAFIISSSTASATTTLFAVSNTGSTTIANGVNILTGCYAVNGTCITTGGTGPATSTNPLMATYFVGTSTTQASTFPEASTTILSASSDLYTPQITASGNMGFTSNGGSLTWDGGELYPNANNTKSLGLQTNMWSNLYVTNASTTNLTVAGQEQVQILEGTYYANMYAGADIGAKANAAYAAGPSTGVHVHISGTGSLSFSTEIAATTSGKPLYLTCDPGVTLNWTGTATSTVINDTNVSGGQFPQLHGVDGCNYTHTNTGAGDTSVGIEIGGTNGAPNASVTNSHVMGFGKGIVLGNNTWLANISNDVVEYNTRGLDIQGTSNSGEQDRFVQDNFSDCVTTANCVNLPTSSVSSATFDKMSLDDAGMHIADGNLNVSITNVHIEAPNWAGLSPYTPIVIDSGTFTHVNIQGGTVVISATGSGHSFPQVVLNGAFLTMNNVTFQNDGGATTLGSAVNNYGNGVLQASGNDMVGGSIALNAIATSSVEWDINGQGIGHAQGTIAVGLPFDGMACNAASGNENTFNVGFCLVAQSGNNVMQSTDDPIFNPADPTQYVLSLENPNSINASSTGMDFQVSNAGLDGAVGASLIFTREGGGSYGRLTEFYQNSNNAILPATTWASNGDFGVGTTTPNAKFTVQGASSTAANTPIDSVWSVVNAIDYAFQVIDEWGHIITSGPVPSVTGGTSSVSGNDRNGKITVTGTTLTSVTLTFAHAYASAPDCTVSDNTTASVVDISSISNTQLIVGFSIGVSSGIVWYQCVQHI